jgi:hypothetical protein
VPSASIGTKMALPTCNDSPTESRKPMPPGSACRRHAFRCSSEQKSAFVVQPEVAQQLSAYRMPDHTTAVSGVTERSAWPRSQVSTQMCAPQLRQSDPMSVSHPSMAPTPSASMAHRAFTATDPPRGRHAGVQLTCLRIGRERPIGHHHARAQFKVPSAATCVSGNRGPFRRSPGWEGTGPNRKNRTHSSRRALASSAYRSPHRCRKRGRHRSAWFPSRWLHRLGR